MSCSRFENDSFNSWRSPATRLDTSAPARIPLSRAFANKSATGDDNSNVTSWKHTESGNASDTPSNTVKHSTASAKRARRPFKIASSPESPRSRSEAPTRVATKAWLEQILDVALSLRICCSRVESTPTRQSRPEQSLALPMKRPGAARTPERSFAEKRTPNRPRPGPPKFGASARCCASPTIISTPLPPNSDGAFKPLGPSNIGSITATLFAPSSAAKSVSVSTASIRPKVFTCGNTIDARRVPAASAAALSAA